MRIAATFVGAVLLICLGVLPGHAEKRVALVIGNSNYQHAGKLPNTVNDAAAFAALLKSSGFQVVDNRSDVGLAAMRRAIGDFADTARDADVAVVYYAGHGIEVDGMNYLVPTDAALARDFDVEDEAVSLERLLKAIDSARRLRLVILDACRDNPFAQSMKRSTRAIGRALARVDPTTPDTLIAFAAKAGSTASDGAGPNSPFTAALVKHIATPGLDIRLALGRVRDEVMQTTRPRQEPFVYGSLGGAEISLVSGTDNRPVTAAQPSPVTSAPTAPTVSQPSVSEAAQAWAATKDTTSQAILEDFIRQFGSTPYGSMARARLEELKKQTVAALPAAAAPTTPPKPHESAPMEGLWKGVLLQPGTPIRYNLALQLTKVGETMALLSRADVQGYPDRFVIYGGSYSAGGTPTSVRVSVRMQQQGHPPAPGAYWCTTEIIEFALRPDGQLAAAGIGQAPGRPNCPLWSTTLARAGGQH